MAMVVIVMAAMRMNAPVDLPTTPMLWAAAGGLLTEMVALSLIWKQSRSDMNVRGALWHIIQTFVGSLLIIVTALVIKFTGFLLIDPLLGLAFGFVLVWASWSILRDATRLLMEGPPDEVDLSDGTAALAAIDGVEDVHHAHAWPLSRRRFACSARLRTSASAAPQIVLQSASNYLQDRYGFF